MNNKKLEIKTILIFIFACVISSRIMILLIGIMHNWINNIDNNIFELLTKWDANWYISIAKFGYSSDIIPNNDIIPQVNWNFFPLYPTILRILYLIFGLDPMISGVIISTIFLTIGLIYIYKYIMISRTEEIARIVTMLICFGPYTFYFSSSYTESLFIMLLAIAMYLVSKKKWILSGITTALLCATRSVGVMFVFVILWNVLKEYKSTNMNFIKKIKAILLRGDIILTFMIAPSGLFLYMYYLYLKCGDALAFVHTQNNAWGRRFQNPIDNILKGFSNNSNLWKYFAFVAVIWIVCIFYLARKKRGDEATFFGISMVLSVSTGLEAVPRYFLGSLFGYFVFAELLVKVSEKYRTILYMCFAMCEGILLCGWFSHAWLT